MDVIKIGGAAGVGLESCCRDLAYLFGKEGHLVVVHGGSHAVDTISTELGRPPRTLVSPSGHHSRYTDQETLAIFTMVCAGKVNKDLVQLLQGFGVNAVGLSGLDGGLVKARRKKAVRAIEGGKTRIIRNDFSGTITEINGGLLQSLLNQGYLPVVGPPALGEGGQALNVDADRLAAAVALTLGASRVVFLSNVPGLLTDPEREETLIPHINREQLGEITSLARGRMGKKLVAAGEALAGGVGEVILADARCSSPIVSGLAGKGTVIS